MKNTTNDLFDSLPKKQRDAIVLEALTNRARTLTAKPLTLGGFVDSVLKDPHWKQLRLLRLRDVTASSVVPSVRPRNRIDDSLVAAVAATVRKKPGLRAEQIYVQMPGTDRHRIKGALAKLRASGTVKTKGSKRSTTYAVA